MDRASALMAQAQAGTGLDDFGEDSFREGLDMLVASADAQARLSPQGAAMFDAGIVDLLSTRLQIEACYARHPEIDEEMIVAPLIGLGAPRTGSTALSCLLAEDPAVRYLRTWEAQAPCPPPDIATEADDPRIAACGARIAMMDHIFPRMKAMLPMTATGPIECHGLMAQDFKSQYFMALAQIPDYVEWLLHRADLEPTYLWLKRVLKLLQWRRPPPRWRLKNPSHTPFIAALDKVFPDARFWMTHREMGSVIPSVVDLYHEMGGAYSDALDGDYLVQENLDWWETGLKRLIAYRDAGMDDRFCDIHFRDVQRDPIGEIERLYAFLGEPLSDEARARMEAWRRDNAREKHGGHSYDAATLGVDLAEVDRRFRFYTDRFGLSRSAIAV